MRAQIGGFMWGIWSLCGVLMRRAASIRTKKQNTRYAHTKTEDIS
jgi:hypothetical protein